MDYYYNIYIYLSLYILNTIFFLPAHAQESLLYHLKIVIKTSLPVRWSYKQKRKKSTMADSNATLVKKRLFQAYTAVSGCSSAEEDWTDTNAYWEILRILSILRKESLLDGFLCCKSYCRQRAVKCAAFVGFPKWSGFLQPNCSYCISILII